MAQRAVALGMSESIMRLRCRPDELPSDLYRIQYEGLVAADTTKTYQSMEAFGTSVTLHFTWNYRGRSPFISLFSDKSYAENWGCKEPWLGAEATQEDNWCLCSIATDLLEDTVVFKLSRLVKHLGLELPEGAEKHIEGGYIYLHKIPHSAVVEQVMGNDIRNSQSSRSSRLRQFIAHLPISERDITSEELLRDLKALGL
ncbi:hypothetical protein F4678DRAFT_288107 [Xylaria arbuscula]|nr:hypothetical protein F4678DRAFT_288107 [Xylaria arbuscula]